MALSARIAATSLLQRWALPRYPIWLHSALGLPYLCLAVGHGQKAEFAGLRIAPPPHSKSQRPDLPKEELAERFRALQEPRDVAALLDVPYSLLVYHLHKHPHPYEEFAIPKRSGGSRKILAPVSSLKIIQRKLAATLAAIYEPRPSVHGFVGGLSRSIRTNAERHCTCRWLLNVDLVDFFPTINFGRVRGLFIAKPYTLDPEVATVLAQICCHQNHLPQGAPTSPVVSNMVCARLDGELGRFASRNKLCYSRFADDISLSAKSSQLPAALAHATIEDERVTSFEVGAEIRDIITANGFSINTRKLRLRSKRDRQEVTGLVINKRVNVRRTHIRQIRAMLHDWRTHGHSEAEARHYAKHLPRTSPRSEGKPSLASIVKGKIDFVGAIRGPKDSIYRKLLRQYGALQPEYVLPFYEPEDVPALLAEALWVLETEDMTGTGFLLANVGIVTCWHVVRGASALAYRAGEPTKQYPVKYLRESKDLDVAILAIPGVKFDKRKALNAATEVAEQGDPVSVHGFPNYTFGDTVQDYKGTVSGFRSWFSTRFMLLDARIVQGMSGGPVLNADGEVIGIATHGAHSPSKADGTEMHGAMPISVLEKVLAEVPNVPATPSPGSEA